MACHDGLTFTTTAKLSSCNGDTNNIPPHGPSSCANELFMHPNLLVLNQFAIWFVFCYGVSFSLHTSCRVQTTHTIQTFWKNAFNGFGVSSRYNLLDCIVHWAVHVFFVLHFAMMFFAILMLHGRTDRLLFQTFWFQFICCIRSICNWVPSGKIIRKTSPRAKKTTN